MTSVESIITLAGMSVGGVDKMAARDEKQKEANSIPRMNIAGLTIVTPNPRAMTSGTSEKSTPNRKEAETSPNMMAAVDTGQETSLSRVFDLVSQGIISGTTAVEVKKIVIAVRLEIRKLSGRSLPIRKAANMKTGSRIPKIMIGPLR